MEKDKGKKTLLDLVDSEETSLARLNSKSSPKAVTTTAYNFKPAVKAIKTSSMSYDTQDSNNWMNIRHSSHQTWLGQTGNQGGFVLFEKPEFSVRAFYRILSSYAKRNIKTIDRIANEYAPRKDGNDPSVYINSFLAATKGQSPAITKDTVLSTSHYPQLARTFMNIESSIDKDLTWFTKIYKTYI